MAEQPYSEFQVVDRSLSAQEQAELRKLSPRATLTPYRFADSRGRWRRAPERLLERYFDAFLQVAPGHEGEHLLMLRLPRRQLDHRRAAPYLCEGLSLRGAGERVLLRLRAPQAPPGAWEEEEEWMPALLPLRGELLAGDVRGLYLGWLAWAPWGELEAEEPPVPAGLGHPSAALEALARFLSLDPDLLAAAAEASPPLKAAPQLSRRELGAWLAALPAPEKDALLLRVAEGEPLLGLELRQRVRERQRAERPPPAPRPRRTVRQLLAAAEQRKAERQRRAAERWAREEARRQKAQAEAREHTLKEVEAREPLVWHQVTALLGSRRTQDVEVGVQLLLDLREVARRHGRLPLFRQKLRQLRTQHGRKSGLLARLDRAGLSLG
jgi:hypothetical protein